MAALVTRNIVNAGTAPTTGAASVSDTAEVGNGGNTFLYYENTGTQKTVTIVAPGNNAYGQPNPDPALTLTATTGRLWIPLRKEFDQGDGTGRCVVTMAPDATGVTVAVVRMS